MVRYRSVFACALVFRQSAWPAKRHARKNHWRAREKAAMRGTMDEMGLEMMGGRIWN
jgi:hypothetical protein